MIYLRASGHAFQRSAGAESSAPQESEDIHMAHSSLESYLGLDRREGLVRIGKRLIRGALVARAEIAEVNEVCRG